MKRIKSFLLFLLLCVLGISSSKMNAQDLSPDTSTEQNYPDNLSSFYVGARGGYLFKNKDLSENPAYYLNNGYFAEVNLGWRSSNNWLGWHLNVGRLEINRELPSRENSGFGLNGYEVLQGSTPNWMWADAEMDDREFLFDKDYIDVMEKTDMNSWYAMTGPEFWFGKNRLQGFISLNAGIGMTKFGHYFIQGGGEANNSLEYNYFSEPVDRTLGPVDVGIYGDFQQFGMSAEAYAAAGYPTDFSTANIKDEFQINFMAKGTIGLEYFLTPRISVNASASYWYIMSPDWSSQTNSKGVLHFHGEDVPDASDAVRLDPYVFFDDTGEGAVINGQAEYQVKKDYGKENLGLLSANVGIRFWLGKESSKNLIKETPKELNALVAGETQAKSLLVTVKDKPTGLALSGVKVTVYKDGEEFYSDLTDVNGALPEIKDLSSGNYEIKGELNNIETTVATLNPIDFKGEARTINRGLVHNDLRFTLVGYTVGERDKAPISQAKTSLNNKKDGGDIFQTSDNDGKFKFQLNPETNYSIYAEKKGFLSNREQVSTIGLDRSTTLYVDLYLGMNSLTKGARMELSNIYYDYDKADIRTDAAFILNDLYQVLISNPTLEIELSSHTDSRGSDSYNQKLSQRRANSAVQYLIDKGIAASRLVAKGYGETRLVNQCANGVTCSDEQHQANRRTEIEVTRE